MTDTKFGRRLALGLRRFHEDEDGIEALQVVMITAIAALVMIAMYMFGKSMLDWLKGIWTNLGGAKTKANVGKSDFPTP